jgi:HAD superfamily hydrolase (TIGR01509 family)
VGTQLKQIRAFVFDLDGTLVTSTLDFNQIRAELGCADTTDVLSFLEGLSHSERAKAEQIIHRHEVADAEQSEWLPGAREFVERCRKSEIPLAILTRNSEHSSRIKITRNQIPIPYLIARENSKPKPDPAALLQIARRFNLATDEILMVGDYKYDLQAGRNAQMPTCLVHVDGTPDYLHLADYRFRDFSEFYQAYFRAN